MESEVGMMQGRFKKSTLAGRQIIEPHYAVAGGEQTINHVAADEAGGAGNENSQ
jgi:hypothetical protein